MPSNYRTVGFNLASTDLSTAAALISAVTDHTLSIRNLTLSNRTAGALSFTVEKASGTDIIGPVVVGANTTLKIVDDAAPGAFPGDSGAAINALVSASGAVTFTGDAWVL